MLTCLKLITVTELYTLMYNKNVDNNWCTNNSDGRWISFFLGFPHLQRENSLNLKELQTIFARLWFETATS